ncbi:PAS domain S-box protein [Sphingomonas sp. AOB5]|uniref:PAS domain-containing sensor histidine kinase n=1 Tax=Sphingomonas sp. AOB5 TaxID=3034017 RepID=UPI0023F7F226|nr:PAS domain S-box protein [Sphingomonas sp. AOB5]MDF7776426.1 PAS domain S-box protein [Sphingomonas sp. AOB5]
MGTPADILDLVHESVVTRDAQGRILSWNKASETLYGHARADALGRDLNILLGSRHESALADLDTQLHADGRWEGELTRTTAAGDTLVLDVRWTVERDAAGNLVRIVETARDISRRKAAEDALRLSEYRYRNMFQAMAVAFWEVDFTGVGAMLIPLRNQGVTDLGAYLHANRDFVRETMRHATIGDVNPQALELFGAATVDQMKGRTIDGFWPRESEHIYIDALVATMSRQPYLMTETRLNRVDGGQIDVLFTVSLCEEARKRGILLIGVVDISARKAAEAALARLQSEFAHATRVSMLGELTASIAHEVNQPLAAIATSGSAAQRWLANEEPDLGEVRDLAERIVGDARRAASIIARVRAMAERRETERVALSLNGLVEESLAFLGHELQGRRVVVERNLAPDLPETLADRTQLQQVIVNLAVNAAQAMESGTTDPLLRFTTEARDGRVILTVEDNGPGIPGEPEKLFDSFYTTKPAGMGMGLPICRTIVEAHGGTIEAANGDAGARFVVTLPATA